MAGRRGDPIRTLYAGSAGRLTQRNTLYKRLSGPLRGAIFLPLRSTPLPLPPVSGPENAPDFHHFTPLRALVAPPRLPALRIGFHAPARYKQNPARTGEFGHKRSSNDHAFSCTTLQF